MTKPSRLAQIEREIENQWFQLPKQERIPRRIEDFAAEMSRQGLNLDRDYNTHVQKLHALLRVY